MSKVAVIGAGNVGATAVYYMAERGLGDIVMVDIAEGLPQSKGLDLLHASPLREYSTYIYGTNKPEEIEGADVVVFTAGVARKQGMDRMDLLKINAGIARSASRDIVRYAPDAVVWHNYDGVAQTVDENLRVLRWLVRHVTDLRYEEVRRLRTPEGFVQQHVLRAKALDGSEVTIPACLIGTVRDGRIVRLEEYIDSAHVAPLRATRAPTVTT